MIMAQTGSWMVRHQPHYIAAITPFILMLTSVTVNSLKPKAGTTASALPTELSFYMSSYPLFGQRLGPLYEFRMPIVSAEINSALNSALGVLIVSILA